MEGLARIFEHEPFHVMENKYGIEQSKIERINPFQDFPNVVQANKYAKGDLAHMQILRNRMMDMQYYYQERADRRRRQ